MFDIVTLIYSVIIGLVQGIAEWLPISSKTQVLLASSYLFNLTYQDAYTFGLFMEIGTIFATIIYFRNELWILIKVLQRQGSDLDDQLFIFVVVATVVTGIVAVPLYLIADSVTGVVIGIPMIIIGLVLIGDAILIYYSRTRKNQIEVLKTLKNLTMRDYIIIGFVQGIAALPGVSRSGITTSTMLIMDIEPDESFRLSFFLSIFASVGAFGVTLLFKYHSVMASVGKLSLLGLLISIITATIVSLVLIDFLIRVAGKKEIIYVTSGLGIIAITFGVLYILLLFPTFFLPTIIILGLLAIIAIGALSYLEVIDIISAVLGISAIVVILGFLTLLFLYPSFFLPAIIIVGLAVLIAIGVLIYLKIIDIDDIYRR